MYEEGSCVFACVYLFVCDSVYAGVCVRESVYRIVRCGECDRGVVLNCV